jgi:hypothetical protein
MSDVDDSSAAEDSFVSNDGDVDAAAMAALNEEDEAEHSADAKAEADEDEDAHDDGADASYAHAAGDDAAGFSSEDDAANAGDHNAAAGDESFNDSTTIDDTTATGEEGDPSSIQAPAGSSAAAADAAAQLAQLLAQEQEADAGEGDEEEIEARVQRKREIAVLEAQLQSGSQHGSKRGSHHVAEEKESGDDGSRKPAARSSQPASQKASHRGPAPAERDALEDEIAGLESGQGGEYGDEDGGDGSEFGGGSDLDSDYSGAGGHAEQAEEEEEIRTVEDVARAKEEREHLIEVNKIRQRQIALILEREKAGHGGKSGTAGGARAGTHDDKSFDGSAAAVGGAAAAAAGAHPEQVRAEYIRTLENLNLLWDELEAKREEAEEKIDRLTAKLDLADEKATELSDSFKAFKREISKEAKFSRTGKPIKLKRILAFEAAEEAADRDVARVRLRHINLLNELRLLEDAVRTKEKLAEGLHLIDFEQLKIENQTLNEKIEERNEELHKLKKKTTTTVQVLTHIKEKLQCVREEKTKNERETVQVFVFFFC